MTFEIYCCHCGQHIEADDFMAGTTDDCPSCHNSILVMPEIATSTVVLRSLAAKTPAAKLEEGSLAAAKFSPAPFGKEKPFTEVLAGKNVKKFIRFPFSGRGIAVAFPFCRKRIW